MDPLSLLKQAADALQMSYSPYSKFKVGSALLAQDNQVFLGTNIENVSFGATICAERSALASAISKGVREFKAIAIIGSDQQYLLPCGICRQVLAEFNKNIEIYASSLELLKQNNYTKINLNEIFKAPFENFN